MSKLVINNVTLSIRTPQSGGAAHSGSEIFVLVLAVAITVAAVAVMVFRVLAISRARSRPSRRQRSDLRAPLPVDNPYRRAEGPAGPNLQ